MIHLRIVTPSRKAPLVLEALERCETVSSIVRLTDAALRPPGDVILADVAREDASVVLADLRHLGIADDGSISIDPVDTVLSKAADAAERAAKGAPSDAVVWEDVTERTSDEAALSGVFLVFIVLAALIASVGIYLDSPILVVGAMVVGPEFGPVAAFCVATVERRPGLALRSAAALAVGFPLAIGVTLLASLAFKATGVTPDHFGPADHSLSRTISRPDFFAFFVAFCAGVAGMLSLTTAKSGALIGVLISVTTIPAAANVAVTIAYADWHSFRGSIGQLGLNLGALLLAGTMTLAAQRLSYRRRRRAHRRRTALAGGPPGADAGA
jgi:uncharacterized hydrophobic protein (TIGR00271 family)